ncbi:hypothetical protein [Pasteuria penetrans]|uniref:hypothetical protein n=1 Tax=Pasteuria penetrans TaxID=86005 RepID=UPI000FB83443|nr:hypothetical protein [Pasteuria penetrans]
MVDPFHEGTRRGYKFTKQMRCQTSEEEEKGPCISWGEEGFVLYKESFPGRQGEDSAIGKGQSTDKDGKRIDWPTCVKKLYKR